jgi:hypothetical protein
MSVQYDQNQPGFVEMRSLERLPAPGGNFAYLMMVVVRPNTRITLDFDLETDDEEDA